MKIERRQDAGWMTVVAASGEVDAYTGPELQEALGDSIEKTEGPAWLLADLMDVPYLDSIGLGILVQAAKQATATGGALSVACGTPVVLKVFDISGTRAMLGVGETVQEATAALGARRGERSDDDS
ncbi:MAG TPA: STAS domain-containing protein [Armatimonadota bacterium]|nr:STAS domain-containing protein [Armatimonadota bacterium]